MMPKNCFSYINVRTELLKFIRLILVYYLKGNSPKNVLVKN